jgi:hypothetical protein
VLTLLCWGPGWLLFAAVVAPWFIAVQARFPDFLHTFFVVQQVQRFASSGFNGVQPLWFYPITLLGLTLPWSPWLLAWRRRAPPVHRTHADVRVLMLVWAGVVVTFFSVPSSKLVGYILPALPPLAFLMAEAAKPLPAASAPFAAGGGHPRAPRRNGWFTATTALAATTCVLAVVAAHFFQPKSLQPLGETLRAAMRPGEPVIFLDGYYYDITFTARLDLPVAVVDAWLPGDVADDSWRRELVDAARLAPPGTPPRLLKMNELAPRLCQARTSWLVGPWPAVAAPAWLAGQAPVQKTGHAALWRIEPAAPAWRSALACGDHAA